jgi:hypothetical protein
MSLPCSPSDITRVSLKASSDDKLVIFALENIVWSLRAATAVTAPVSCTGQDSAVNYLMLILLFAEIRAISLFYAALSGDVIYLMQRSPHK